MLSARRVFAPPGYLVYRLRGGGVLVAREDIAGEATAAVREHDTLLEFARAHAGDARLAGRGPVYIVATSVAHVVVRHCHRGGAVARLDPDRYLHVGVPRPIHELLVGVAARERGIDTPEVLAAAAYPAGAISYRGDVATALIPDAADLAAVVFGADAAFASAAAGAAGGALRGAHDRGLIHADLNLKNLLVQTRSGGGAVRVLILDLDRARLRERVGRLARQRMLRRFRRSWRKWERRLGTAAPEPLAAFLEAYARDG